MARPRKVEDKGEVDELDLAVDAVKQVWGDTAVFPPGQSGSDIIDKHLFPTEITPLDDMLGGGFAKGSIIEVFGAEGAGKTTIALQIMVAAQQQGMKLLFIDMENALKPDYAKALGLDIEDIYMCQPSSMEEALDIAETFIKTGKIGLVVVDSLASLVPSDELEKKVGEELMGLQARLMSQWLRKMNPIINKTHSLLMFTNQMRDNLSKFGFGPGTVVPGGRAVKFYSSYRLQVTVMGKKKNSAGEVLGNELQITAVKNKYARPYRKADLTLTFGEGIDIITSMIDQAVNLGFIIKNKNWYEMNKAYLFKDDEETYKFNGSKQVKDWLLEDSSRLQELKDAMERFM